MGGAIAKREMARIRGGKNTSPEMDELFRREGETAWSPFQKTGSESQNQGTTSIHNLRTGGWSQKPKESQSAITTQSDPTMTDEELRRKRGMGSISKTMGKSAGKVLLGAGY